MKKFAISMLAVVLALTMICAQALAVSGDLTIRDAKAYADPDLTQYIGTIPKYTSVLVLAYGAYADVYINGVRCYVQTSALTQGQRDYDYVGYAVLKAGANVYQRPTVVSKYVTTGKSVPVLVYAVANGYALIRNPNNGVFGFASVSDMSAIQPN